VIQRSAILGRPHTYLVQIRCALDQPLLAEADEALRLLTHLETVREAFDARVHAWLICRSGLALVFHHHAEFGHGEEHLRLRWRAAGGGTQVPFRRLLARLTSLSGFMQTVLQRYSRDWNQRRGRCGSIWAGRYRACLLADDAALLAAMAWLEDDCATASDAVMSSRGRHSPDATAEAAPVASLRLATGAGLLPVRLAAPPLRVSPDGTWFPTDEAPPGLAPPPEHEVQAWLDRLSAALGPDCRMRYGAALRQGWALGRPESLTDVLARLGRNQGRGRSRCRRDLQDDLGLCGVWG